MTGRTSLTPFAASMRDPDPGGARKFAAKAWRDLGTAAFTAEQLRGMDRLDRELIEAVATRLYGRR